MRTAGIYREWYKVYPVKYEMIKFTQNREFGMLVPSFLGNHRARKNTRNFRVHSAQHLDIVLGGIMRIHDLNRTEYYNMYATLAAYENGIPKFSPKLSERDTSDWKMNHHKEMVSYDFLIDIDAGDHGDMDWAFNSAKMIKNLFDKAKCPYELRFSGCGFHFMIPHKYLHDYRFNPDDEENIYTSLNKIAKILHDDYTEMIDTKIYDSRRLCKIPYSLAMYEDGIYTCFPFLSDKEFYGFRLKDMLPNVTIHKIKNRYTHVFNPEGNIYTLLKYISLMR